MFKLTNTLFASLVLLLQLTSTSTYGQSQNELLVTGRIIAEGGQDIVVPRSESWQVEIKWLAEEGSPIKKGDVVAVFDGSSLESEIEQLENDLEKNEQERVTQLLTGEQDILSAQLEVEDAETRVKLAKIDVSQPKSLFAAVDYEEFLFEAKVANLNLKSAQLNLANKNKEHQAKLEKIRLSRLENERKLKKAKEQLAQKSIVAQTSGSIVYNNHPHRGTKISAGDNVQMGWKVAKIPSNENMYIEAKVADVDLHKLSKGMDTQIIFDIDGTQTFAGKIRQISTHGESIEPWGKAKYYTVSIALLKQPTFKLSAGMSVLGRIPLNQTSLAKHSSNKEPAQ